MYNKLHIESILFHTCILKGHEAVSSAPTIGGWERSVLQGAFQAILNDVDYYVYVEQDLLARGQGWIERCIATLKAGKDKISYGAATEPTTTVGFGAQPLQQSLVVVSRAYLPTFVQRILENKVSLFSLGLSIWKAIVEWALGITNTVKSVKYKHTNTHQQHSVPLLKYKNTNTLQQHSVPLL